MGIGEMFGFLVGWIFDWVFVFVGLDFGFIRSFAHSMVCPKKIVKLLSKIAPVTMFTIYS